MHPNFSFPANVTTMATAAQQPQRVTGVILPAGFIPTKTNVICGRANVHHSGNEWCRQLVSIELRKYHEHGLSRKDKTELVTAVVAQVCARNPHGIGFVKKHPKSGRWFQISESQARRKILELLQDALNSKEVQRFERKTTLQNNFLGEYVSKQTAALKHDKERISRSPPLSGQTNLSVDSTTAIERDEPQNHGRSFPWPSVAGLLAGPTGLHQGPEEQRRDTQDALFLNFLHKFAASIPDNFVHMNDPFEPDPFPNRGHPRSSTKQPR